MSRIYMSDGEKVSFFEDGVWKHIEVSSESKVFIVDNGNIFVVYDGKIYDKEGNLII